jgi:hypothetical protein
MNKMRRSRSSESEFSMSTNQAAGVYGKGGGPAFEQYQQDRGKDTIVTKTSETSFGTAKDTVNQLRRSTTTVPLGQMGKKATTSTIKRGPNKLRRSRGSESEFK